MAVERLAAPPEQEVEDHRGRELRRTAEAAPLVVEVTRREPRPPRRARPRRRPRRPPARPLRVSASRIRSRRTGHLVGPLRPGLVDRLEQLPEARLAVPRPVREVGAGEERAAVVVEHAGHRPAALPGHRDRRLHVDGVDVGPLLAVDLDAHVVLVEVRRRRLVLERLVRHHVAPVAGGVPDAQQDGHVRARAPRRTPPAPTPASRRGSPRAAADTATWHSPAGSPWSLLLVTWPVMANAESPLSAFVPAFRWCPIPPRRHPVEVVVCGIARRANRRTVAIHDDPTTVRPGPTQTHATRS